MPIVTDDLATFVAENLVGTTRDLLGHCEAAGLDLAAVMDLLADPFVYLDPETAGEIEVMVWDVDPAYALVDVVGRERASEIVMASERWCGVEVVERHDSLVRYHTAVDAIQRGESLAAVIELVNLCRLDAGRSVHLFEVLSCSFDLHEVARVGVKGPATIAEGFGSVLRAKIKPLDAVELMIDQAMRPGEIVESMTRLWNVEGFDPGLEGFFALYAQLTVDACKTLGPVVGFCGERAPPEWWLPVLRRHGLRAGQAALFLKEAGYEAMAVVSLLSVAGYDDDDILGAMTANAYGLGASLFFLLDSGWGSTRLAATLARRGSLPFEVRDHLMRLGFSKAEIWAALLNVWAESDVSLTLSDHEH